MPPHPHPHHIISKVTPISFRGSITVPSVRKMESSLYKHTKNFNILYVWGALPTNRAPPMLQGLQGTHLVHWGQSHLVNLNMLVILAATFQGGASQQEGSMPSHPTALISIFIPSTHLYWGLPDSSFHLNFPTEILDAFLYSHFS